MPEEIIKREIFVGESVRAIPGTFDTGAMARGEPGLPARFVWREQEYSVFRILDRWKETSPCKTGGMEKYVRKHWYKIETGNGEIMKIYFERQPQAKGQRKKRWWLYTIQNE